MASATSNTTRSWSNQVFQKPAVSLTTIVYINGFLDLFGVSMILPLILSHARDLGASQTMAGVLGSVYGFLQLFSSPIMGHWSDVAGRKQSLMVCLLLSGSGYAFMGAATTVTMLLLARIPLGLFKHSQNIAKSYLTEAVDRKEQSKVLGNFGAASSLGFILGPMVGGHIAEHPGGFYIVALISAVIFIANAGLMWFYLPDRPSRAMPNIDSVLTLRSLGSDELTFSHKIFINSLRSVDWSKLWDLFLIKFLLGFSILVFRSNFVLMLRLKYNTTPTINGYIISYGALISALFGFGVGNMTKMYKDNNSRLLLHMGVLQVVTLAALTYSPSLWIFVICQTPLSLVTTVARVAATRLTIARAGQKGTGAILGLSQSNMSIARMLSPFLAGLALEISANGPALCGIATVATAVIIMVVRPQDPKVEEEKKEQ